jgi:hypothetical protein
MNTEFMALRTRARINRDKAIEAIRRDYEVALEKIATLEQELLGQSTNRLTRVGAAIESVIPLEADFTTTDLLAALETAHSHRAWYKRSVDAHVNRLRERGLIRRVRGAKSNEPAVYVRVALPVRGTQVEDGSLLQAIGNALVRPMNSSEVTVAVLEAGYQTKMTKSNLRYNVAKVLKRGGFKQDGGKWLP